MTFRIIPVSIDDAHKIGGLAHHANLISDEAAGKNRDLWRRAHEIGANVTVDIGNLNEFIRFVKTRIEDVTASPAEPHLLYQTLAGYYAILHIVTQQTNGWDEATGCTVEFDLIGEIETPDFVPARALRDLERKALLCAAPNAGCGS